MDGRPLAVLAGWMVLLSGCLGASDPPQAGPVGETPSCEPAFPDGTPKDCTRDEVVEGGPDVPDGWACFERIQGGLNGWTVSYGLWHDGAGNWALGFNGHGSKSVDRVVATLAVFDDTGALAFTGSATGGPDVFAELGPVAPTSGTATISTTAFLVGPRDRAEVHTLHWGADPWFVFADSLTGASLDGTVLAEAPDGSQVPAVIDGTLETPEGNLTFDAESVFLASSGFQIVLPPSPPPLISPCLV